MHLYVPGGGHPPTYFYKISCSRLQQSPLLLALKEVEFSPFNLFPQCSVISSTFILSTGNIDPQSSYNSSCSFIVSQWTVSQLACGLQPIASWPLTQSIFLKRLQTRDVDAASSSPAHSAEDANTSLSVS